MMGFYEQVTTDVLGEIREAARAENTRALGGLRGEMFGCYQWLFYRETGYEGHKGKCNYWEGTKCHLKQDLSVEVVSNNSYSTLRFNLSTGEMLAKIAQHEATIIKGSYEKNSMFLKVS